MSEHPEVSSDAQRRPVESSGKPSQSRDKSEKRGSTERLIASSGTVVAIDQFMLGNPQFLARLEGFNPEGGESQLRDLAETVETYGGCVFDLEPGTHLIDRDPRRSQMIIYLPTSGEDCSAGEAILENDEFQQLLADKAQHETIGRVFIDTRCLAFLDSSLLSDAALLAEFSSLRKSGNDKAARDLLRARGGAVRYGFQRYGDELAVVDCGRSGVIALWPDIVD